MSPLETVPTSPDVRGYYLGVSDDEAWFIYLEPGSAASTMYGARGSLALCDVKTDAGGAVTFRSAVAGGGDPFQFAGRLSHDTLVGTMRMVRSPDGFVYGWSIAPRRVLPRFLTGAPDALSAVYHNFDEGGDSSGEEIVLLDLANRVAGFSQHWAGGPSTVWDVTGNRVRDTLYLTWRSLKRNLVELDTVLIRGDTLTGYGGTFRGAKRFSIPEMFRAPNRAECK